MKLQYSQRHSAKVEQLLFKSFLSYYAVLFQESRFSLIFFFFLNLAGISGLLTFLVPNLKPEHFGEEGKKKIHITHCRVIAQVSKFLARLHTSFHLSESFLFLIYVISRVLAVLCRRIMQKYTYSIFLEIKVSGNICIDSTLIPYQGIKQIKLPRT